MHDRAPAFASTSIGVLAQASMHDRVPAFASTSIGVLAQASMQDRAPAFASTPIGVLAPTSASASCWPRLQVCYILCHLPPGTLMCCLLAQYHVAKWHLAQGRFASVALHCDNPFPKLSVRCEFSFRLSLCSSRILPCMLCCTSCTSPVGGRLFRYTDPYLRDFQPATFVASLEPGCFKMGWPVLKWSRPFYNGLVVWKWSVTYYIYIIYTHNFHHYIIKTS